MDDIGVKPETKSENPASESKGEAEKSGLSTKKDGEISSASKAPVCAAPDKISPQKVI